MSKTSFMERKAKKLAEKQLYHASYLKAYEYHLNQIGDPEAEIFLKEKKEQFEKQEQRFIRKAERQDYNQKHRVWEIDFLRAIIIFCMLFEHLIFDFGYMFPGLFANGTFLNVPFFKTMNTFAQGYWIHPVRVGIRLLGLVALAFLIGINTRFSRSNLKRGLILTSCGILMAGVFALGKSYGFCDEYPIMNVLVSYGLSLLIFSAFEAAFKRYEKAWPWICLTIAVVILVSWVFVRYLNMREVIDQKYRNFWFVYHGYADSIPRVSHFENASFDDVTKILLGVYYYGDDWLGLFPTIGYVFLGAFVGNTVYKNGLSLLHCFDKKDRTTLNENFNRYTKGFLFFGHHTLWIYLFHQVVYIGLILLIAGLFMGLPLGI